jgi:hypothetical protein
MGFYWEMKDWAWGLSLIVLTTVVHTLGVVTMALAGFRLLGGLERKGLRLRHAVPTVIGVIGAVGMLLAVLHGVEYTIWAAAYLWIGALDTPVHAMLYSIDSMTTRGASGLTLQPQWQMMGALEAADGMILFGISTAFIFAAMQAFWPLLRIHRR